MVPRIICLTKSTSLGERGEEREDGSVGGGGREKHFSHSTELDYSTRERTHCLNIQFSPNIDGRESSHFGKGGAVLYETPEKSLLHLLAKAGLTPTQERGGGG